MIKRILQFFFMLSMCISAHSQAVTYNAIATAYVTTTISQNVVFDSTMQQGGTFTFSVLAHNGGGRAGQSDTANVRIQFYNAAGGLMGTFQSSYTNNLPNPNAVCGNPCIDTAVPWTTLTVSTTVDSVSAANIAYAKVSMYGIDGSYWAGDYGPWYRAPTFTLNGGGNLTYNPEFGPYNNVTAQGWTSSPGFGACQGAWGGSNACIVNSDGVPGSSTVGLVANANGGGPSATGGTTSGQAGGYNNSMSTTNAGTGATAGAAPSAPTVTGTSTSYTYRSVVTGNVTRVYRTLVTTTNYSDGTSTTSNGTEALYYTSTVTTTESNGIVGGNLATTVTTTTTTVYNDGTQTTSSSNSYIYYGTINQTNAPTDQIVTSGGGSTAGITSAQQTRVDNWTSASQSQTGNYISVEQISGNYNTVNITQDGNKNKSVTTLDGSGYNTVNITQTGTANYLLTYINGYNNSLTSTQTNTNSSHYSETSITGNNNSVIQNQSGNTNNIMFTTINGNGNTVNASQSGTGNHYLDTKLTGNNNTALVTQLGSTQNKATIDLTNAGGPATVDLQQTGGKNFSIIQTCTNPSGCVTTVRQ